MDLYISHYRMTWTTMKFVRMCPQTVYWSAQATVFGGCNPVPQNAVKHIHAFGSGLSPVIRHGSIIVNSNARDKACSGNTHILQQRRNSNDSPLPRKSCGASFRTWRVLFDCIFRSTNSDHCNILCYALRETENCNYQQKKRNAVRNNPAAP